METQVEDTGRSRWTDDAVAPLFGLLLHLVAAEDLYTVRMVTLFVS